MGCGVVWLEGTLQRHGRLVTVHQLAGLIWSLTSTVGAVKRAVCCNGSPMSIPKGNRHAVWLKATILDKLLKVCGRAVWLVASTKSTSVVINHAIYPNGGLVAKKPLAVRD